MWGSSRTGSEALARGRRQQLPLLLLRRPQTPPPRLLPMLACPRHADATCSSWEVLRNFRQWGGAAVERKEAGGAAARPAPPLLRGPWIRGCVQGGTAEGSS